jgi:predicted nucleic acid-binding protein
VGSAVVTALFDSDILLDFLQGIDAAAAEIDRYSRRFISRISWMEVQVGSKSEADRALRESFLNQFAVVELDAAIARRAVSIRREHRLKLPDAIIWASALQAGALLITRNTKDFPKDQPSLRFPYKT